MTSTPQWRENSFSWLIMSPGMKEVISISSRIFSSSPDGINRWKEKRNVCQKSLYHTGSAFTPLESLAVWERRMSLVDTGGQICSVFSHLMSAGWGRTPGESSLSATELLGKLTTEEWAPWEQNTISSTIWVLRPIMTPFSRRNDFLVVGHVPIYCFICWLWS